MDRYLILIGSGANNLPMAARAVLQEQGLHHVFGARAMTVFSRSPGIFIKATGRQGIVLGPVFSRHGPPQRLSDFNETDARELADGSIATLIERHWGAYVAVCETEQGVHILRAPMGTLACYYVKNEGGLVAASDPDILRATGFLYPEIDWREVASGLIWPDLPGTRTALAGLTELLPGQELSVQQGIASSADAWNAWSFVNPQLRAVAESPEMLLERTIRNVCASWASQSSKILLGVSGGLDSSVVAACLAKRKQPVECLTLYSEDTHGDERDPSAALAEHLDLQLWSKPYLLADIDIEVSVVGHRARPGGRIHELAYHKTVMALCSEIGADAFFTGNGGDSVFYNSQSARALVDRFYSGGLSRGLFRTLRNICLLTECNAFEALRQAFHIASTKGRPYQWQRDTTYLHADLLDNHQTVPVHPWLNAPKGALPGKAAHIAMLLRVQHHMEGYDQAWCLPVWHPLVSQPVVEFCLGIPTWWMCEQGRNRSFVRSAFSSSLPASIIDRRTKGGPDGFAISFVDQHVADVRARILEGELVKHRIVDRSIVEPVLRPGAMRTPRDYMRLLLLLDTEAWIRKWQTGVCPPIETQSGTGADKSSAANRYTPQLAASFGKRDIEGGISFSQ